MNHAPGAGSIARLIDKQSSTLPLCYGCPLQKKKLRKEEDSDGERKKKTKYVNVGNTIPYIWHCDGKGLVYCTV